MPEPGGDTAASAHLDRTFLDTFRSEMDDDELVAELVEMFLLESPARLDHLRSAVLQGDWTLVKVEAHTLKGGAANFGAGVLAALCGELEHLDPVERSAARAELVDRITAEFEKVQALLRAFLQTELGSA